MPARTSAKVEKRVLSARRRRRRGAVVLAAELGLSPSTVGRILSRHQMAALATIDPITGERVRSPRRGENRYEHSTPGAMIHVDVKKLGRIVGGAGWRVRGGAQHYTPRLRDAAGIPRDTARYEFVHIAVDDYSRLAYAEVLEA